MPEGGETPNGHLISSPVSRSLQRSLRECPLRAGAHVVYAVPLAPLACQPRHCSTPSALIVLHHFKNTCSRDEGLGQRVRGSVGQSLFPDVTPTLAIHPPTSACRGAAGGAVSWGSQPGDALFIPEGWWHQVSVLVCMEMVVVCV